MMSVRNLVLQENMHSL